MIVDLDADGFALTSADAGVRFDLNGDGDPEQTAWTSKGGDDAFLALDVIRTGRIENGRKLIGGLYGGENGFTTLHNFEQTPERVLRELVPRDIQGPALPGLPDGAITEADPLYSRLIFWVDSNHNGVSEGSELLSAAAAGVVRIFTGYVGLDERDANGNVFRYAAQALVKNRSGVPLATEVRSVRFRTAQ